MHERVVATIERLRRDDSDFITVESLRAYTGCSVEEARAGIVAVFGQDWLDRQDASMEHDACRQCSTPRAVHPAGDGVTECPGDFA